MTASTICDEQQRSTAGTATATDASLLSDIGVLAAGGGIAIVEDDIAVIVARARVLGVASAATDVLADRVAPDVVRARALQRVSAAVLAAEASH